MIYWLFTRDFRFYDHPQLQELLSQDRSVKFICIDVPEDLKKSPRVLTLRDRIICLMRIKKVTLMELRTIASSHQVHFITHEEQYSRSPRNPTENVTQLSVGFVEHKYSDLLKSSPREPPYRVFTPFYNAAKTRNRILPLGAVKQSILTPLKDYREFRKSIMKQISNFPATGAELNPPKVSAWINLGIISAREILDKQPSWKRSLMWREFYIYQALNATSVTSNVSDYATMKNSPVLTYLYGKYAKPADWNPLSSAKRSRLVAWKNGRTGQPFVDWLMKNLRQTGDISNRGRLIVASWLIFDEGISWVYGAKVFQEFLNDYDRIANDANWIWVKKNPLRRLKPERQAKRLNWSPDQQ